MQANAIMGTAMDIIGMTSFTAILVCYGRIHVVDQVTFVLFKSRKVTRDAVVTQPPHLFTKLSSQW